MEREPDREAAERDEGNPASFWSRLTGDWRPALEPPLEGVELAKLMTQASAPAFGFYFMLAMATGIATFGLLANSAAAIIGAMIIAPLMAPIMGLGFGIVILDGPLIIRSLLTVTTGSALVVALAFASTEFLGLRVAGSEILSRSAPTLIDLGVAAAAGSAAAFAYTRKSIAAALAGVAIAVALVPPLSVTGIGLALGRGAGVDLGLSLAQVGLLAGETQIALGSFVLFLTNFAGIVLVAALVFVLQGYGSWRRAGPGILIALVVSGLLVQPLGVSFGRLYIKSSVLGAVATLSARRPDIFDGAARIDFLDAHYRGDTLRIELVMSGPESDEEDMAFRTELLGEYLSELVRDPIELDLDFVPIEIKTYRWSGKPDRAPPAGR